MSIRVVVWGVGVAESRTLWERATASPAAVRLADGLSPASSELVRPERWAVEVKCPEGDDVLRLVEETAADEAADDDRWLRGMRRLQAELAAAEKEKP